MNFPIIFRTIRHLKVKQVFYQIKNRIYKAKYRNCSAPECIALEFAAEFIPRPLSVQGDEFTFLNLSQRFVSWNDVSLGTLYTYNLNYFDFINDGSMSVDEAGKWIDRFIDDVPGVTWGMDPYPIALRGLNWIKFISANHGGFEAGRLRRWNDSLYSQYSLLEKKLEWHLLGNHLLEDLYSLYIASIYFNESKMFSRYSRLLKRELEEQILDDGAHYEQSPMYHCILLDRLLDCYNISISNVRFEGQRYFNDFLKNYASKILGHLSSIVYENGELPLFNDSAEGVAPTSEELFSYAKRLGIECTSKPLGESGYRKMANERYEVVLDIGNITASYQPGHSHADALNYELRIDGTPVVVDTGISTYNKNVRRQYERSTIAHNCVSPNGADSSEVWGGFRVGRRCRVAVYEENDSVIVAGHNGFAKPCKRRFELSSEGFVIEDWYDGDAVSYVHLAEGVDPGRVDVNGAIAVNVNGCEYSTEYNKFHNGTVVEVHFNGYLKYTIR